MVEGDDERVLVDEPLSQVTPRAVDGERPVLPRAVRQNHAGKSPIIDELVKGDVSANLCRRNEVDERVRELLANRRVLLLPEFFVPTRKAVLDFSVRAAVLFKDGDGHASVCESVGNLSTCGRSADDCNAMAG